MGWGAWTLSDHYTTFVYMGCKLYEKKFFPWWDWKFKFLNQFEAWVIKNRVPFAWVMMIYSIILGVYTGILLSAFNARPLWNTSILGPLFLVSGFSTGLATTIWISKDSKERKILSRIDLAFIFVELFLIVHLFMGFLAGSETSIESAKLFLGGSFTVSFWVFVVLLGLIFPGSFRNSGIMGIPCSQMAPFSSYSVRRAYVQVYHG